MLSLVASLLLVAASLDADPTFLEGMQLFEDFEYGAAVERFERALQESERSPAEQARLQLLIGISYAELADLDKTSGAFERALVLDPQAKLPVRASPKIQEIFEEARAKAAAAALASAQNPEPPSNEATVAAAAPTTSEDAVESGGPGLLLVSSLVVGTVGALALTSGAAVFAWGWLAIDDANRQPTQAAAARLEAQAVAAQVSGQALLFTGALALLVGAGLGTAALVFE